MATKCETVAALMSDVAPVNRLCIYLTFKYVQYAQIIIHLDGFDQVNAKYKLTYITGCLNTQTQTQEDDKKY